MISAKIAACGAMIALAQEDLTAAEGWAQQMVPDAGSSLVHCRLFATPAHVLIAQQRKEAAATALESLFDASSKAGLNYVVVEIRALQAMTASTTPAAMAYLTEALELAQPEGYVRTFVDKGEPMAHLLRTAMSEGIAPLYARSLLAAFEAQPQERAAAAIRVAALPDAGPSTGPVGELVEPLSQREMQVLQLLVQGLSNREIADRLFITIGTVKTHVHHIYGKLDVESRAQAIAQARELDLA
jgi:LuxR family maltose regulon positive regulatory protein